MKEWKNENKRFSYIIGFGINAVVGFFSVYPAIGVLFLWFGFFNPSTTKQKLIGTAIFLGLMSIWFLSTFIPYKLMRKNIRSKYKYLALTIATIPIFLVIAFYTFTRW